MNNMTIRLCMLACIIAATAASLAFLTPCAVSAAQPKSSIYGTPAQLVEDLKSAGFDLVNARFTKPELLVNMSSVGKAGIKTYQFANFTISLSERDGRFFGFSMRAKPKPDLPSLPLGKLREIMELSRTGLLSRYGSAYASEKRVSENREKHYYYLLIPSTKNMLWTVMVSAEVNGKFASMVGFKEDTGLAIASYEKITGSSAKLSGASLIYQDFWKLGLGLGAQSSRPDIMSRGVSPSESLAAPEKILQFGTSIVGFDPTDNNVLSFLIGYQNPYRNRFVPIVLDEPILDSLNFPTGSVKWLVMKGPKAVVERYGPSQGEKGKPMNLAYGLLLEIGGVVGICDFRFDYELDGDDSTISVYGSFMPYNMYKVQEIPAPEKRK